MFNFGLFVRGCMILSGVLFGFGAAGFQSLSYLFSRWFLQRVGATPVGLLGASHVLMGAASLALLPFFVEGQPPWRDFALPLLGAAGFYVVGQAGLFAALRRADSSRIAPLLGFKIFVLALISVAAMGERLSVEQWGAVVLSVGAVFLLNETGGRMSMPAIAATLVAVVGYSLSDLSIKALVDALAPAGPRATMLAVCWTYILCGVAGVPMLLAGRGRWPGARVWAAAAPYAFCWFMGMVCLYAAFATIGVVFGNIIQSTRGLISIVLGVGVARWGMLRLESRVSAGVLANRVAGAVLMTVAIALYLSASR